MAKHFVANSLWRIIDRAIQVHGALGYSTDTPLADMLQAGPLGPLRRRRRRDPPDAHRPAHDRRLQGPRHHEAGHRRPAPLTRPGVAVRTRCVRLCRRTATAPEALPSEASRSQPKRSGGWRRRFRRPGWGRGRGWPTEAEGAARWPGSASMAASTAGDAARPAWCPARQLGQDAGQVAADVAAGERRAAPRARCWSGSGRRRGPRWCWRPPGPARTRSAPARPGRTRSTQGPWLEKSAIEAPSAASAPTPVTPGKKAG